MRYLRYALLFMVILSYFFVSAARRGTPLAQAALKGTLRVAVVGFDRESTAPWEGSTPMLVYSGSMYDPLIAADDRGQLSKAGLVTDWQANDAGDVVTLTLRSGVQFHNGDPLTADDVKFSFETWTEQTGGSPRSSGN